MYNSGFYKLSAREQLRNNYWAAVLCAIVCMVPSYFVTRLSLIVISTNLNPAIMELVSTVVQIFVVNILMVGFIRFLSGLEPREEAGLDGYEYNMVFSGYKMNFKRTLAATFMRQLKVFLWGLLAAAPTIAGIVLLVALVPLESLKNLFEMWIGAAYELSDERLLALSEMIDATIPHLSLYMFMWLSATAGLIIPFIRKTYLYMMIPFIMAEHPDMTCKKAFRRSQDIMGGYRWRFFKLQLSFIGFVLLVSLSYSLTGSLVIYCLAQAVLLPYQYMTYYRFFKQRDEVILYNIEKYGDHMEQENRE